MCTLLNSKLYAIIVRTIIVVTIMFLLTADRLDSTLSEALINTYKFETRLL